MRRSLALEVRADSCRVTKATKDHEVYNAFLFVMRHRYSFSARGRCANLVSVVILHLISRRVLQMYVEKFPRLTLVATVTLCRILASIYRYLTQNHRYAKCRQSDSVSNLSSRICCDNRSQGCRFVAPSCRNLGI